MRVILTVSVWIAALVAGLAGAQDDVSLPPSLQQAFAEDGEAAPPGDDGTTASDLAPTHLRLSPPEGWEPEELESLDRIDLDDPTRGWLDSKLSVRVFAWWSVARSDHDRVRVRDGRYGPGHRRWHDDDDGWDAWGHSEWEGYGTGVSLRWQVTPHLSIGLSVSDFEH